MPESKQKTSNANLYDFYRQAFPPITQGSGRWPGGIPLEIVHLKS
jgi:hypothetical protein